MAIQEGITTEELFGKGPVIPFGLRRKTPQREKELKKFFKAIGKERPKQPEGEGQTTEELFGETPSRNGLYELHPDLSPPERRTDLFEHIKRRFRRGSVPLIRGSYGREAMWGRMDTQEALKKGNKARLQHLDKIGEIENVSFTEHPVRSVLGGMAELIPFMGEAYKEGAKYGLITGAGFAGTALVAGQAGPQVAAPEELATVPGSFLAGMQVGGTYGLIKTSMDIEGGNLYLDLIENDIPEGTARPLALSGGLAIGLIEMMQFKLFKKQFMKALDSKPLKNALLGITKRYVETTGGEIAEEELQEIVGISTEVVAGLLESNPEAMPDKDEVINRLVEVAKTAGPGMAGLALPGAAVDVTTSLKSVKQQAREKMDLSEEIPTEELEATKEGEVKPGDQDIARRMQIEESQHPGETLPDKIARKEKEIASLKRFNEQADDIDEVLESQEEIKELERELVEDKETYRLLQEKYAAPSKQPLIEEAKKAIVEGKSLEEFVEAQKAPMVSAEDIELKPEQTKNIAGMAMMQEGKVYGEPLKEGMMNHADVIQKYKLNPKKAIPGFITKKGKFLYQYEEDIPKSQLTDIWKKANAKVQEMVEADDIFSGQQKIQAREENILPKRVEKITQMLEDLESEKVEKAQLQDALREINFIIQEYQHGIKPYVNDYLKEEYAALDSYFKSRKGGVTLDEVASDLGLESDMAARDYLNDLVARRNELREDIQELKAPTITKQKLSYLKTRLSDIQSGVKQGQKAAVKEVKTVQNEVIDYLKQSGLESKDRAKFTKRIKNTQTIRQLKNSMADIENRVERLVQADKKTKIGKQIDTQLKRTKPLKKGQKRVGKYDYATNELFKSIREIQKLSKENAFNLLEELPANTEMDLIKKRFASLQANKKSASVEVHQKVLDDIKKLMQAGEKAKTEQDFIDTINQQEKIREVYDIVKERKLDKKKIRTKIGNLYRRGFSNVYSMLNSMFNKKIAEEYNPEIYESRRNNAMFQKTQQIMDKAKKIYNARSINEAFKGMGDKNYELVDFQGESQEISKWELIDIYNSLKNDKKREDHYNAYGEEQIQYLLGELTDQDMDLGDYLQEMVQGYREIHNQRNIRIKGMDLGYVENYWPATSEREIDIYDDIRIQGETPSAEKERARGRVIPVPKNAWTKAQKHIADGEHVRHLSEKYEELQKVFSDRRIKNQIKKKFGEEVYITLQDQLEGISLNKQIKRNDGITKAFSIGINNWVTAKISFNPGTLLRQLISVGNYAEVMPAKEWNKGFIEGISHPKKTFDFLWENAPFLKTRFNRGYSEALERAIGEANALARNEGNYRKFLTIFPRTGDVTAIIYGGYPLVKHQLSQGKSMEEAIKTFEKVTIRAQQSALNSSLSGFQRSRNGFARVFMAFKNTTTQYTRKLVDANYQFLRGDISKAQYTKTMAIYAVIQPILYAVTSWGATKGVQALAGTIDEDEWESLLSDIFMALALVPVRAVPLLNSATEFAIRRLSGQKAWKALSLPLLDDIEMGLQKATKNEPSAEDYFETILTVLEPTTGLPAKTLKRYFDYIFGEKKGRL